MIIAIDNVVPLLRSSLDDRRLIMSKNTGLARDIACLKELSLQLNTTQILFKGLNDTLHELCDSSLLTSVAGTTDHLLTTMEALQTRIHALICVMAAHQPSA